MLKNESGFRRVKKQTLRPANTARPAVKIARSLMLAGVLAGVLPGVLPGVLADVLPGVLPGALSGQAHAAPPPATLPENLWGDITLTQDTTSSLPASGLWRDGQALPNAGNLNIADKTLTLTHTFAVGNGSVTVGTGGHLEITGSRSALLAVNQGALVLNDGATLTLTDGTLLARGGIRVTGTLDAASALSGGILAADKDIHWGDNDFVTTGTLSALSGGVLTARSIDLRDASSLTVNGVVATGADSVIESTHDSSLGDANFGTRALHIAQADVVTKNLTVGALRLGDGGPTNNQASLLVQGKLTADTVTLHAASGGGEARLSLSTFPEASSASGQMEHRVTHGVTITRGELYLQGRGEKQDADGAIIVGAVGQKLMGDVALNGAAPRDALLITDSLAGAPGATHSIEGTVQVAAGKQGSIAVDAGDTLRIKNLTVSGSSGNTAVLTLNNVPPASFGTVAVTDTVTISHGTAILTRGTLHVTGQSALAIDDNSSLTVGSDRRFPATLHVGGDYNHSMGAQTSGLIMAEGGVLRTDGQMTLTAADAAQTQTINNRNASAANTLQGSIVANTLHTDSTAAAGVTAKAGRVQIMGHNVAADTDVYTTGRTDGRHSIEVSSFTSGSDSSYGVLTLGATSEYNVGSAGSYGGTVQDIRLTDVSSELQFGHGNFTVKTLNAASNGMLFFNDDTGFGGTNTVTLGAGTTAVEAQRVSLNAGRFAVNGDAGLKIVDGGTAAILTFAKGPGWLNKLTLGDASGVRGAGLHTANHSGTYTIDTLVLGHKNSTVEVAGGTVVTNTLDLNDFASSDRFRVSESGVWQINEINTEGGGTADFTLSRKGTLLLGQNITLGHDGSGNAAFLLKGPGGMEGTGDAFTVKNLDEGTLGSTGDIEIAGVAGAFTVGAITDSASGTQNNLLGQRLMFTGGTPTDLMVGGAKEAKVTLTGNGADDAMAFTNASSITLGGNGKSGTLALGGNTLSGTGSTGGRYDGLVTVGNAGNSGTLQFLGGDVTLSNVRLTSGSEAGTSTIDLAEGSGTLTLTMSGTTTGTGAGLVLNGANILNVGTAKTAVNTNYEIAGGVTITKGTAYFGNNDPAAATSQNTLRGGLVLNGTTWDDAGIAVNGGVTTVDSLTVAEGKTGWVGLFGGTLAVNSDLVLNKGHITAYGAATTSDASATNLLQVNGDLTTGAVSYWGTSAPGTFLIDNAADSRMTIKAESWAVKDADGKDAAINVNSSHTGVKLDLAIGTGGITAADFNIASHNNVTLLGAGGKITLTGADASGDDVLDVVGTLSVGRAATDAMRAAVSQWSVGTLRVSGGTLDVVNGSLSVDRLDVDDNKENIISVGTAKGTANPQGTTGKLFIQSSDFGASTGNAKTTLVVNRGFVQFGGGAEPADLAAAMMRNKAEAALVVNQKTDLRNVITTIGTSAQDGVRANSSTNKTVEFGPNSLTYVNLDNTGTAADDFAITTGGTVYLDTGASLQLSKTGGLKPGDTMYLLESTAGADSVKGMWADANTQSRLLHLNLSTNADRSQLVGTAAMANMAATMPGISGSMAGLLTTMVNTVGEDPNSPHSGIRFASRAANRNYLANDKDAAPTLEGAAQMGAVAGVQTSTMGAANAASTAVTTRTSLTRPLMDTSKAVAVHQDNDGALSLSGLSAGSGPNEGMKNGLGVWIMPLYQSNRTWGQEAENFSSGMSSDLGGVAMGADYTVDSMFRFGAAFNTGGGSSRSSGDFNSTRNSFTFWGINLYGGWTMNKFGLTADVGYTRNDNEVKQELPGSMQMDTLKSDINSSAWTAGLKGEYKFETSLMDVIPHVGVRYMGLTTNSYNVESGGTVFSVERDFQSVWTFPVGVAFGKAFAFSPDSAGSEAWTFRPQVDLSVIPAAGDFKARSKARIPAVPGSADLSMQIVDELTFDGGLGFELATNNLSFGLNYTIQASEHRVGHGVFGTVRYAF